MLQVNLKVRSRILSYRSKNLILIFGLLLFSYDARYANNYKHARSLHAPTLYFNVSRRTEGQRSYCAWRAWCAHLMKIIIIRVSIANNFLNSSSP
jgi:hypothetical protein